MTYRIDLQRTTGAALLLAFQGLLDEAALSDLRRRLATPGAPAHVLLLAGTEVDPACIAALRRLPVARLECESPFLTAWLAQEP